jgi:AAA domain
VTAYDDVEILDPLRNMVSAQWLMRQDFPPLEYVVPGLIPEGLTLLAAAPKIGKSWMVLGLGIACASGGYAFGQLSVARRPVLYLALEDGQRRLKDRLTCLGVNEGPANLHLLTVTDPGSMFTTIRAFVESHAHEAPLVVLDTLGKAMPPALPNETTYARDYRVTGALKAVVGRVPGASLIAVHHTRKLDATDFLDAVSGTQGVAGAADTVLVLSRNREESNAILRVTSRDAREGSYALEIDDSGRWNLSGTTLEEAGEAARSEATTAGLGTRMAELVAYVNEHPGGVRASEVAAALHMSSDDAGKYLRRACDGERITKPTRGLYLPVRSMSEVSVCPILPVPESPPLSGGQSPIGHSDTSDSHLAEPDREGTTR